MKSTQGKLYLLIKGQNPNFIATQNSTFIQDIRLMPDSFDFKVSCVFNTVLNIVHT